MLSPTTGDFQDGYRTDACALNLGARRTSWVALTKMLWRTTMTEDVIARVVLRNPDGSSILDATQPITAETIAKYRVGEEVVQRASVALEKLGFKILEAGPTGLTISGDRALFERIFHTVLQENTSRAPSALAPRAAKPRFAPLQPLRIPDELASVIAAVVMPAPPELMP
jgi:hypothetical protein